MWLYVLAMVELEALVRSYWRLNASTSAKGVIKSSKGWKVEEWLGRVVGLAAAYCGKANRPRKSRYWREMRQSEEI